MSAVKVYSGTLPISKIDEMYELFSRLGFTVNDMEGTVLFKSRKGFIKKLETIYNVKIYMIGNDNFSFGIQTERGMLEVVARLYQKGGEWYFECIKKEHSHLCSSILSAIKSGIKMYERKITEKSSSNVDQHAFKMSRAFESFLDGLAEITAISAAIKYPIVERKTIKLNGPKEILGIIEYLYSKYKNGKYVIILLGSDWMFSIAVDLDTREFTPSLVVWSSNLRLLGEKALETLNQIHRDEDVKLNIYSMQV